MSSPAVIWWIRRDLRLADNAALHAALETGHPVQPVFILDPAILGAGELGAARVSFLCLGLRSLDRAVRARGSRLVIRSGPPAQALSQLVGDCRAQRVFAEGDVSPYARRRDAAVAKDVNLTLVEGESIHSPQAVRRADGGCFTVFTPYRRAWAALPLPGPRDLLPPPARLAPPPDVESLPIPEAVDDLPQELFPPDEESARARLREFTEGEDAAIYRYAEGRDRLDWDGTSRLSPYLHFGVLSARQVVVAAVLAREHAPDEAARTSAEIWLSELVWREFFLSVLFHFPDVLRQSFRRDLRAISWENDPASFAAWCEGRTGVPVIDAAMRQLRMTGWMHNRARMITASFLVKDLLIDWRWGEAWFLRHLRDADLAANNGGWQWCAGTGTDAAPYFRIFNPVLQGQKFDPQGDYVRRYVPELQDVPLRYIHHPWEMPADLQRQSRCVIGNDYPAPLVDHAWARQRVLHAYSAARGRSRSKTG
jgi:deoxyribodipyrimidine photo-lyase